MDNLNEINHVIILAAGRSRRMEHLSKQNPKCQIGRASCRGRVLLIV